MVDGEIQLTGDKKFFLVTEKDYGDFVFEGEIFLPEGQANSGFMFRCKRQRCDAFSHAGHDSVSRWGAGTFWSGIRRWPAMWGEMPGADESYLRHLFAAEADLRAFIGSLVHDRALREDIFQNVAVVLWKRFGDYDAGRPFSAWARGVAARVIKRELRRDARFPVALAPEAIDAVREAFDRGEPLDDRRREALRECLQRLPERSRRLLSLRYDEGVSCEAVADRVGRGIDAVYQNLSRLRKKLEACVLARLKKGDA
ncbi:hypothetical protein BH23VER1_BH23VER1_01500 [soil metagenome]